MKQPKTIYVVEHKSIWGWHPAIAIGAFMQRKAAVWRKNERMKMTGDEYRVAAFDRRVLK